MTLSLFVPFNLWLQKCTHAMFELLYYNSSDLSTQRLCPLKSISVGFNEGILFCFIFSWHLFLIYVIQMAKCPNISLSLLLSVTPLSLKVSNSTGNLKENSLLILKWHISHFNFCVLDLTCRHVCFVFFPFFVALLPSCSQMCHHRLWDVGNLWVRGLRYYSMSFSGQFKGQVHFSSLSYSKQNQFHCSYGNLTTVLRPTLKNVKISFKGKYHGWFPIYILGIQL